MHLAVLMTNTDESDFAQRHPKDGEKFKALIQSVRPDWTVSSFHVKDGVFPDDILAFDGCSGPVSAIRRLRSRSAGRSRKTPTAGGLG